MPAPLSQACPKQEPLTEEVPCVASAQPRRRLTVQQEVTLPERHAHPARSRPKAGGRLPAGPIGRATPALCLGLQDSRQLPKVAARTSEATHRAAEGNAHREGRSPASRQSGTCSQVRGAARGPRAPTHPRRLGRVMPHRPSGRLTVPRRTPCAWAVSCPPDRRHPETADRTQGRDPPRWKCLQLPLWRHARQSPALEADGRSHGRNPFQSEAPRRTPGVRAVLCPPLSMWLQPQLLRDALRDAGLRSTRRPTS